MQPILEMYRCMNGMAPTYLDIKITPTVNIHSYNTRFNSSNNVRPSSVRIETAKHSFRYSGATSWNNLPESIKSVPNLKMFEQSL